METRETTPVPFWQEVVIILSVFVIAFSASILIGVSRLNAAANQKQVEEEVNVASLVSSQEKKEVTVQPLPVQVESVSPVAVVINEGAILKAGEGIEHTLIRQLRVANPERGIEWAQKRADQFADRSGFVQNGKEIRVKDGNKQIAYVLSGDQIVTFFDGKEVRRTQIADNYQQVQPPNLQPFEYQYGSG